MTFSDGLGFEVRKSDLGGGAIQYGREFSWGANVVWQGSKPVTVSVAVNVFPDGVTTLRIWRNEERLAEFDRWYGSEAKAYRSFLNSNAWREISRFAGARAR